jgi:hypothetical protein
MSGRRCGALSGPRTFGPLPDRGDEHHSLFGLLALNVDGFAP